MSESMRDPMQRQLTSGRRSTPAALLPGEPRPSTETSILAISARSAWTPRRWRSCQRPGVTRWVSVRCVPGLHPRAAGEPGRGAGLPHLRRSTRSGRGCDGYVQHCFDTGHPLRRREWQIGGDTDLRLGTWRRRGRSPRARPRRLSRRGRPMRSHAELDQTGLLHRSEGSLWTD